MNTSIPVITHSDPLINPKSLEKIEKKLFHYMRKAIKEYNLIKKGDRIMVCLSGGKDSFTMLMLLKKLQIQMNYTFEIFSFTLDQSQPGWNDDLLRDYLKKANIPFEILKRDTYSVVKKKIPEGKTYCSLCSRLRRGNIYAYAKKEGYNKVALGHHRDDMINSLMMAIFFNGEIRSMSPKMLSEDQSHLVIRPLAFCQEKDIAYYAKLKKFPIIPCTLCGSQPNRAREKVKNLIHSLSLENPKIPSNMLRALQNIKPRHMLDKNHWDFNSLDLVQGQRNGTNESSSD